MSYAEEAKKILKTLRSKMQEERKIYAYFQDQLAVYYPNEWKIVAEAIKAVALYYHGEIVRCKHDLADWMNGHDVAGEYGTSQRVKKLHDHLQELPALLEIAGKAKQMYEQQKSDPVAAASANITYEHHLGQAEAKLRAIEEATKMVERKSYAQR